MAFNPDTVIAELKKNVDGLAQAALQQAEQAQQSLDAESTLSKALEDNPNEICTIYRMSPIRRRERSVDESGERVLRGR